MLREGMAADMLDPAGVYFGTTGGTLYASSDSGALETNRRGAAADSVVRGVTGRLNRMAT